MIQLFKGRPIEIHPKDFIDSEFKVIEFIIKKKFLKGKKIKKYFQYVSDNFTRELVVEMVQRFSSFKSKKRVEENNKFIYKRASKALRNKYYKPRGLKNN